MKRRADSRQRWGHTIATDASLCRPHRAAIVVAVTALSLLSGCAHKVVSSQSIESDAASSLGEPGGLVYSLPKTLLSVAGAQDAEGKITYTVIPVVMPDHSAQFRVRYAASNFADDDLNIAVDKNGLLGTVKTVSTDRTGDIVIAIAKAGAAAVFKPSLASIDSEAPKAKPSAYPFTALYDFGQLVKKGGSAELPDGATLRLDPSWKLSRDADRSTETECKFSLCFRSVMPVQARIDAVAATNDKDFVGQFAFVAINPLRIEGVDLQSGSMATRTNTFTFEGGLLTSVAINKPSAALAIANLPLNVLKAILAVPTELLTLRISNVDQEKKLATSLKELLDAQQALQKAQADAAKAATGAASAPVASTGSPP